jgi:hypothetical protein
MHEMAMTNHLRVPALISLLSTGLLGVLACTDDDGGAGTGGSPTTTSPSGGGASASGGAGATASGGAGASATGGGGASASGGGGASTGDCPLTGTWTITGLACGAMDITTQYFNTMTSGTMTVTDLAGGGCAWTIVNVSDACTQSESYETTDPIPGTIALTSHGIQSCDPAGCKFTDNGEACELGAHAGMVETVIEVEGDTLTTTGPQGPCASFLGMDTTVTWVRGG